MSRETENSLDRFFGLPKALVRRAVLYIKGDTGAAATVSVGQTQTLPAGSSATVQNVGDENNAVFDFGIPKGDKGDKGDPGTSIPLPVSVANGGTGANTAANARANLGAMAATADGNTILTGGTEWDRAPIGIFADQITARVTTSADPGSLADDYDATQTYHAGDYCTNDRLLYKCKRTTTGVFAIGDWDIVTVASLLDEKQDTISDLSTIRSGAAAGATAVQPSAMPASETWSFVVDDGQGGTTTVTKNVAVYAAQGAGA